LIDSLSGGNPEYAFPTDDEEVPEEERKDPYYTAMVNLFTAVGREELIPDELKE
jgi:hypothetical protein